MAELMLAEGHQSAFALLIGTHGASSVSRLSCWSQNGLATGNVLPVPPQAEDINSHLGEVRVCGPLSTF